MYYLIIAAVLLLDQITKYIVRAGMELYQSIPIIDGVFHITYIQNSGAAFSMLQGKTFLLLLLPLLFSIAFFAAIIKLRKSGHWTLLLSLSMIVAGGIGNLIDRATMGSVTDFLDFRFWPIFNVADIAVCCGCGLLLIYVIFVDGKKDKAEGEKKASLCDQTEKGRKSDCE